MQIEEKVKPLEPMTPAVLQARVVQLVNYAIRSNGTSPAEAMTVLEFTKLDVFFQVKSSEASRIVQPV